QPVDSSCQRVASFDRFGTCGDDRLFARLLRLNRSFVSSCPVCTRSTSLLTLRRFCARWMKYLSDVFALIACGQFVSRISSSGPRVREFRSNHWALSHEQLLPFLTDEDERGQIGKRILGVRHEHWFVAFKKLVTGKLQGPAQNEHCQTN